MKMCPELQKQEAPIMNPSGSAVGVGTIPANPLDLITSLALHWSTCSKWLPASMDPLQMDLDLSQTNPRQFRVAVTQEHHRALYSTPCSSHCTPTVIPDMKRPVFLRVSMEEINSPSGWFTYNFFLNQVKFCGNQHEREAIHVITQRLQKSNKASGQEAEHRKALQWGLNTDCHTTSCLHTPPKSLSGILLEMMKIGSNIWEETLCLHYGNMQWPGCMDRPWGRPSPRAPPKEEEFGLNKVEVRLMFVLTVPVL